MFLSLRTGNPLAIKMDQSGNVRSCVDFSTPQLQLYQVSYMQWLSLLWTKVLTEKLRKIQASTGFEPVPSCVLIGSSAQAEPPGNLTFLQSNLCNYLLIIKSTQEGNPSFPSKPRDLVLNQSLGSIFFLRFFHVSTFKLPTFFLSTLLENSTSGTKKSPGSCSEALVFIFNEMQ